MTGSDRTFEALVFGAGPEGARRKAAGTPRLVKPLTAELGNVTPVIVAPGPWSQADVQAQGMRLATWLTLNAGFNCNTPRLIITHKGWPQREALQRAIVEALGRAPTRRAYYPGAAARYQAFLHAYPQARQIGRPRADELPWAFILDVDPQRSDEICFRQEAFCSLFAETALAASSPEAFLAAAVEFANERLWGTLAATLVAHPTALRDPASAAALDRAVAGLRYGTVTVNQFPGACYGLGLAPWGSFPGQTPADIQSGIGFVNNVLMFAAPQKSVMYGPFRSSPELFAIDFPHLDAVGRRLAVLQARPGWGKVPGLIWATIAG
jgi:acyl-CoA reductase-like NAD-dependent aldehyde dehydrogenase